MIDDAGRAAGSGSGVGSSQQRWSEAVTRFSAPAGHVLTFSLYSRAMPTTDQAVTVKLELPEHVYETLSTWAASEIGCTAEDVLEALSEELSSNAQLRAFAAGLVTE